MPDLDDELRALLAARAGGVHPGDSVPSALRRRVRRRRVTSAAIAAGSLIAVVTLGSIGVAAMLRDRGGPSVGPAGTPSPTMDDWRGLWPQGTRADAEEAQRRAADLQQDFRWQLSQQLVLERFGIEILGWSPFFEEVPGLCVDAGCQEQRFRLGDCPAVQRGGSCHREAIVFLAQLLRSDQYGIWFVTRVNTFGTSVDLLPSPPPVDTTPLPGPTPSPVQPRLLVIGVRNGTDVPALATETALFLERQGYRVPFEEVGDAADFYEVTVIFFRPGRAPDAQRLADRFFPNAEITRGVRGQPVDVLIVLGSDYEADRIPRAGDPS